MKLVKTVSKWVGSMANAVTTSTSNPESEQMYHAVLSYVPNELISMFNESDIMNLQGIKDQITAITLGLTDH